MTVFNKDTDLPSSINTVEKLYAWAAELLTFLYPGATAVESSGSSALATTCAPFYITADPQGARWRHISRASFVLDNNWQKGGKMYTYVQDLGTASIPAEFKS
jgi:hypothetical protein